MNFRQGHEPALISTLDPILLNRDTIIYFVKLNLKRVVMKNFTRKEYLRKYLRFVKESFIDRENLKNFEKRTL